MRRFFRNWTASLGTSVRHSGAVLRSPQTRCPVTLFLSAVLLALPVSAFADKLDLPLKMLLEQPQVGVQMLSKSLTKSSDKVLVDVIVKSDDVDLTIVAIEDAGGIARTVIGDIFTAQVPVDFLPQLANREEVSGVEASKELRSLNDSSRQNTGVSSLQSAALNPDSMAYKGKNIVVGVIDSGLDLSRSDFADASGNTRIEYMRFQTVAASGFTYTECVKSQIKDGSCTISASNDLSSSHGTHVTGVAAGSNATYMGVAPEADIMFVRNTYSTDTSEGTTSFSSGLLDGITEIFKKSDTIDKPAVINISQGSHIGAHDNTSLLEQGINNAIAGLYSTTGKTYGRAIVAAAGNENIIYSLLSGTNYYNYAGGIHAAFDVPDMASHGWRMWVLAQPTRVPIAIDAWFGAGQSQYCKVSAKVYNFTNVLSQALTTDNAQASLVDHLLYNGESETAYTSDNKVAISVATSKQDSQNTKPRALFAFGTGTAAGASWSDIIGSGSNGYVLDVVIRASGGSCSGDMWIEGGAPVTYFHFLKGITASSYNVGNGGGTRGNGYFMQSGDNNKTIDIPGTASSVIAVGAYLQEKPYGSGTSKWTDINGTVHDATDVSGESSAAVVFGGTIGCRSPFSSFGPAVYNYSYRKPEILAPGDPIISTLATGYSPANAVKVDSTHFKLQGTSQASPHVAGIVALLFQKNNTLTAEQVKSALISTASSVPAACSADTNGDGYGKVNALTAMATIAANTSGFSGKGDVTPDSGSSTSTASSCSLIVRETTGD